MTLLTISIPCWLIPLLVGLISAILGYLLGRLVGGGSSEESDKIAKLEADLEACLKSKKTLKNDLDTCLTSKETYKRELNTAKASLANSFVANSTDEVALIPFNATAAKAVFGKKIKENDLTVVEGIGPKIQGLFHNHDVKTWKALSECSIEKCQEVLKSGGDRFKMHNPGTWTKQAKLAYEGKWQELKDWQDQLDGGK
ncbi:hypothetical protein J1D01_01140 [Seonamhaeicola sp. NFXS20]|uniref:hypothetical protein n=1 Tax=Seonamhaeicola sp. NFXS20 TaxID=2816959 RepID=UPI003B8EA78D